MALAGEETLKHNIKKHRSGAWFQAGVSASTAEHEWSLVQCMRQMYLLWPVGRKRGSGVTRPILVLGRRFELPMASWGHHIWLAGGKSRVGLAAATHYAHKTGTWAFPNMGFGGMHAYADTRFTMQHIPRSRILPLLESQANQFMHPPV